MFDFLKNEDKEMARAVRDERNFTRERDAVHTASSDDASYFQTQAERSDLLRWQQEFQLDIEEVYHELLSHERSDAGWVPKRYKVWDGMKKVYVECEVKPLCTPQFAEELIRISLKPWLNKNAVNSNLGDKEIVKMLRNTHNAVVGAIADAWGVHGIETIKDANAIIRMIKNYTDPAAYRALNGWTKKMDSSMIKRLETEQEVRGKQDKTGMLGWLSGS